MEDERQRKKEQTRSFFFFFFFFESTKGSVCSQTLWQTLIWATPSPPPPSPLNLQKRIWQSDRTFSFRSDVLFIIFSVFVTTLISPYLLRHGIFGGFKVFFFLTEGKDTNSGACFLLLGGRLQTGTLSTLKTRLQTSLLFIKLIFKAGSGDSERSTSCGTMSLGWWRTLLYTHPIVTVSSL